MIPQKDSEFSLKDEVLILNAQAGDILAFDRLIHIYEKRVFKSVFLIVRNQIEAEDLTQEVFIKAFTDIKKFRRESSFFTWVYWIIIDICSRYFRSSYFSFRKKVLPIEETFHEALNVSTTPLDSSIKKERDKYILDTVSSLPKKYRLTIILCDIEKLPYAEAAIILKCNVGTLKSRLFRARVMLKKTIDNRH